MNPYLAIACGTVALMAAVALWFTGRTLAAGVALAVSVAFDILFVFAVRNSPSSSRK
jgi:uncharacterized protein involved in response to NO